MNVDGSATWYFGHRHLSSHTKLLCPVQSIENDTCLGAMSRRKWSPEVLVRSEWNTNGRVGKRSQSDQESDCCCLILFERPLYSHSTQGWSRTRVSLSNHVKTLPLSCWLGGTLQGHQRKRQKRILHSKLCSLLPKTSYNVMLSVVFYQNDPESHHKSLIAKSFFHDIQHTFRYGCGPKKWVYKYEQSQNRP